MISLDRLRGARIKPITLTWIDDDPCPTSYCPLGAYVVNPLYCHAELLIGYGKTSSMISLGRIQLPIGSSVDDVKAACQKDFNERVLALLQEDNT